MNVTSLVALARAKPLRVTILLAVLGGVFALFIYINYLISELITVLGTILLNVVTFYLVAVFASRALTFPGSLWLWKRSMESFFCRELGAQLGTRIAELGVVVESLTGVQRDTHSADMAAFISAHQARNIVSELVVNLRKQEDRGTLKTASQMRLLRELESLKSGMERTVWGDSGENLWTWFAINPSSRADYDFLRGGRRLSADATQLLSTIYTLNRLFLDIYGAVSCFKKVWRWLFDKTLGSLDLMRVELEGRFNAEQQWIRSSDGTMIDCMFVPGVGKSVSDTGPTVLFCNPNAGYYEFIMYQCEWLEFYTSLGINMMLFNYRGFGRSGGRPSPEGNRRDGESLVHWLHARGIDKVAVHGESIGGLMATHVARYADIHLLIADRTFCTLEATAQYMFSPMLARVFKRITGWVTNNDSNYIEARCYKVLTCDPADEVIADMASLKAGVARKLVSDRLLRESMSTGSSNAMLNLAQTESLHESCVTLIQACELLDEAVDKKRAEGASNLNAEVVIDMTAIARKGDVKYSALESQRTEPGTDSSETAHELQEEDHIAFDLLKSIRLHVESVNAGGCPLGRIFHLHLGVEGLHTFLCCLEVWGSYCHEVKYSMQDNPTAAHRHSQSCMASFRQELSRKVAEFKAATVGTANATLLQSVRAALHIDESFRAIEQFMKKSSQLDSTVSDVDAVVDYSRNPLGSPSANHLSRSKERDVEPFYDLKRTGYLIPLNSGHNGNLTALERSVVTNHLFRSEFLAFDDEQN